MYAIHSILTSTPIFASKLTANCSSIIDGYLSLYAVRFTPPQARNTHLQGEILVDGYLVVRTSRCEALLYLSCLARVSIANAQSHDQNMKSHGNLLMNKIYNPKNIKPPVPTDIDETDSALERYIRAKYQYRTLADGKPQPPSRDDESYNRPREATRPRDSRAESPEGSPPPLPPKSNKFLGMSLRSSSSTSNLRRFGTRSKSSTSDQWSPPPPKRSTSGLGAPVADVTTNSFEAKMAALQDMGFTNDRRNEMVLKGLNEDLNRAIDTLQRLGEGNGLPITRSKTPTASRANTSTAPPPMPPRPATQGNASASASTNPFDKLDSNPAPQAQQVPPVPPLKTGAAQQNASFNPFDQPVQTPHSAQPLEASFQNLQVTQPLFPHSTGGYPQHANTMPLPQPTYQQPFTPPMTATFAQNGYASSPQPMNGNQDPFFQTMPQQVPQPQNGVAIQPLSNNSAVQNNPFFSNSSQNGLAQPQSQQGPLLQENGIPRPPQHANTMPALSTSSPFGTSPFGPMNPSQGQQNPQLQPQSLGQASHNPFQQNMGPPTPQSAGFSNPFPHQQTQPHPQQLAPQATGRVDKGGILSLYGSSAPSPVPPIPQQHLAQPGVGASPVTPFSSSFNSTPQSQAGFGLSSPQPGAGSTANTSRNPFDGPVTAGSGLAAQAGLNFSQPSSGLGLGIGANGTSTQPSPTGTALNTGTGLGAGPKSNNPFPSSTTSPFAPTGTSPFAPTPTSTNPFPTSTNPFPPTNNNPFPASGGNPFPPASNNPFPTSQPTATTGYSRPHMSQPSVDINGFQTGRHSPDAFTGLSARYG